MIPQIDNVIDFSENNEKIIIPSKTYKMDIENDLIYIDEYLQNITFKIENGNLIEKIKQEPALVTFTIEDGYLIISDEIEEEE